LKICPIYLKFFKFSRDDKNLKISQKYWKCAPIILKIWQKVFENMPNVFKLLNKLPKCFGYFSKILKMWLNYFWKYAKNFLKTENVPQKLWKCAQNILKIFSLKMCAYIFKMYLHILKIFQYFSKNFQIFKMCEKLWKFSNFENMPKIFW
jgi:hypothetical protein